MISKNNDNDLSLLSHLSSPSKLLTYTQYLLSLPPSIPHRSPSLTDPTAISITPIPNDGIQVPRRPSTLIDRTNPLAVLLFLLEGLIFLRFSSSYTSTAHEGLTSGSRTNEEFGKENFNNTGSRNIQQSDAREEGKSGGMENEERCSGNGVEWESWKSYIQEVYTYSPNNTNKRASTQALWSSPLSISAAILPSLTSISRFDENDLVVARTSVEEACRSAYIYLASLKDPSGELGVTISTTEATGRIKLLLSLPSDNFPSPLAQPLAEVIATTLSSRRRIIGPTSTVYDTLSSIAPSPLTFRSVLSTILEFFFGATHFGLTKGKEGDWRYATRDVDNEMIKGFYVDERGEDSSDRAAGVRVAMLSISGRDDMAKYMSKNSMDNLENRPNSRSSNSTNPTYSNSGNPPPGHSTNSNPTKENENSPTRSFNSVKSISSMESYNSSKSRPYSMGTASQITGSPPHRRVYSSSGSSSSNLLESRGVILPFETTPYHVPFANLAPLPEPSRRYTQPIAPLNINSLSPEERRDLVWRSKKLHKVFGETLAEGAASQILVGNLSDRSPIGNRTLEADILRDGGRKDSSMESTRPDLSRSTQGGVTRPLITSSGHNRRSSYPPPSPSPFSSFANDHSVPFNMISSTQPSNSNSNFISHSQPMSRAISSPTPRSPLLEPPSPDSDSNNNSSTQHTPTYSSIIPRPSAFSALGGTKEQQKEERRKKLEKLQRLLGERVPAHLALNDSPGRGMSITELNANNLKGARGLGGRFKGALGLNGNRASGGNWAESYEREKRTRGGGGGGGGGGKEEEILVINLPEGSNGADANSSSSSGEKRNEGDQMILGMTKARKLEQVFGDLPPSSLFLSRSGSVQMDTPLLSPPLSSDPNNRRPSHFNRSIDRYRNSIASLSYLIERDPDSLDDITQVYAGRREEDRPISRSTTGSGTTIGFGEYRPVIPPKSDRRVLRSEDSSGRLGSSSSEDGSEEIALGSIDGSTTTSTRKDKRKSSSRVSTLSLAESVPAGTSESGVGGNNSNSRSNSLNRQKTAKKAQKLASFFGTTQGQNLLHDLEEAIVEEEGIDEEERREVLGGVSKLRMAGRDRRGAAVALVSSV